VDRVEKGEILALGEFRHAKAETITWRDKGTGKQMSADIVRYTCEFGDVSIGVTENLKEGLTPATYKCPFTKGEQVAWSVSELKAHQGSISGRGTLTSLSKV